MIRATIINGRFDNSHSTPLMRACTYGSMETVKTLVENWYAALDITNLNDENCLIIAVRHRQLDVVKYLC